VRFFLKKRPLVNQLQHETSPYLLQHANNPVEWYPWKPIAFERARRENKPILVSIGYSACHWCHVMEHESFEDAETAAFMNAHFINIKVDREERPDVDQIYMEACQIMNGNGGWPLNCFLLPDGRPFFAGTYFPPHPAHNRPAWLQVLNNLYHAYRDRYADVVQQAEQLMENIASGNQVFRKTELLEQTDAVVFSPVLPQNICFGLQQRFDTTYGGFGGAPKFPGTMNLSFLLDYQHYTGEEAARDHVHFSLRKMIGGGIYDQLGGGFSRYTVDQAWLVPHFEKMLYDNALLLSVLAKAYRQEPQPLYAQTIAETLAFVAREMTSSEGGFYAALDADSEGEEGRFYVWSQAEIDQQLGPRSPLFCQVYGVSPAGNWEGHNILWRARELEEVAAEQGMDAATAQTQLADARGQLLKVRDQRIRPGLDDKHLLSWNALLISAYCHAYHALGEESYRQAAHRAVQFVQAKMTTPTGELWHTYKAGKAQYQGFLDDYADWIAALLDMYTVTFELTFIDQAVAFTEFVLANFLDESDNLFYFTSATQKDVPLRRKEMYDNAVPSGNATMALNLQQLAVLVGRSEWAELARAMLKPMTTSIERYPTAFGRWARAALYEAYPTREVVIIGEQAVRMALELQKKHYPNTVFMAHSQGDVAGYPLLAGRPAQAETLIYVCQNFECQLPVSNIADARAYL